DQRTAADAGTGHDQAVPDHVDALDPVTADRRVEEVLLRLERRGRQVVVLETRTGFEHADPVALLGQAQGRHRAAEAGADDQHVVVDGVRHHALPSFFMRRSLIWSTAAKVLFDMPGVGRNPQPRWVPTDWTSV